MPPASRYAGQPVDVSSRRSITILAPAVGADGTVKDDASHAVIGHFYHEGEFWRARVPLDGVARVCGQAFNFSSPRTRRTRSGREVIFDRYGLPKRKNPVLNHVQSRFVMKPGQAVELFPLHSEELMDPVHRVDDFVYSLEAVGPPGVVFNVRDGLMGNTLSAHRFLSTTEMVFERVMVENQYVMESPPLPLGDHQMRELLARSLMRSHKAGMTEPYYLYRCCGTNNCTSSPFQIVDSVVQYKWAQRIGSMLYRLPLNPRFYLRVRGLDSDPSYRKLVRTEFADFIQDPELKRRKRATVRERSRIRRAARN